MVPNIKPFIVLSLNLYVYILVPRTVAEKATSERHTNVEVHKSMHEILESKGVAINDITQYASGLASVWTNTIVEYLHEF